MCQDESNVKTHTLPLMNICRDKLLRHRLAISPRHHGVTSVSLPSLAPTTIRIYTPIVNLMNEKFCKFTRVNFLTGLRGGFLNYAKYTTQGLALHKIRKRHYATQDLALRKDITQRMQRNKLLHGKDRPTTVMGKSQIPISP